MVAEQFEVVARDGAKLPVHRWRPPKADVAWIALHGATSHGGWFATVAEALAERGVATYAPDRRGSGLVQSLGLPDSQEVWVDDLRRVATVVAEEIPNVVLAPWCFAIKLAVPALAKPLPVKRMVALAPAFFFSQAVSSGFAAALARGDEFPVPAPDDAFVGAPHSLQFLATDPLRWRTMTRKFTELSKALLAETRDVLPKLTLPMTAVFATGDRIVDNARGMAFADEHKLPRRSIEGSHSFFLDDPHHAAAYLEPLLRGA